MSEADGVTKTKVGRASLPWSRALMLIAIVGPPLWLGGVKPWTIPVFLVVVVALLARRCFAAKGSLHLPAMWWLGLAAAGLCLVQWLPLPGALSGSWLGALAPKLSATVTELIAGTPVSSWSRISVTPDQTALEAVRLLGLSALFVAAAQLRWGLVAAYVSVAGTAVAVIGLGQKLVGAEAIYGVYLPRQPIAGLGQGLGSPLLTSFVNPNHQSGLLLLGLFAAAAVASDLRRRAREASERRRSERLADRAYLAFGSVAIQATALVLSLSRAALLAALIVTPVALVLVRRRERLGGREPASNQRRRIALAAVMVGLVGLALSQGAHQQLQTLRDPGSFEHKFRVAIEGLGLVSWSPVVGIGRGAFVDLFPLIDSAPGSVRFAHLESTPIAFVVEWGPVPGGALVVALGWWWWRSFRAHRSTSRRLALCGLLALAIQSAADFSLDYLGVTAAAVALAGSLAAPAKRDAARPKLVAGSSVVAAVLGVSLAVVSIPGSWSARQERDEAILAGERPVAPALERTPLDPFLHLALAREHALAGDWVAARARAEVAARLWPASLDAHLLAATAAAETGDGLAALEHLRRGLEGLHAPISPALLDWLVARSDNPAVLAEFAPHGPEPWTALARALATAHPDHARALAQARVRTHPEESEPLRILANMALSDQNPSLALHYARLLVQLRPDETEGVQLRARARFAHRDPSHDQAAVAELEEVRDRPRVDDPGLVDELLITALMRVGDERALVRAAELVDGLLARRATPEQRKRRSALSEAVRAARARD